MNCGVIKLMKKIIYRHVQCTQAIFCTPRFKQYQGAGKSLARPTSRCILFNGENISFDASLVLYVNSINIPPNMIINRIYVNLMWF